MVSAWFCAESATPENAIAQMIVKILFISFLYQFYGRKGMERDLRKFFRKTDKLVSFAKINGLQLWLRL